MDELNRNNMPLSIRRAAGFTLIELIATLVVVGILAAFAAPRFFGKHGFEERGFHDETIAILRYAQKAAVAQRRPVCVSFTLKTVSLQIADNPAATACNTTLQGPGGQTPYKIDATEQSRYRNADVKYSAFPATLIFDPLGRASATATIQVADHPRSIVVDAQTGYVHEN